MSTGPGCTVCVRNCTALDGLGDPDLNEGWNIYFGGTSTTLLRKCAVSIGDKWSLNTPARTAVAEIRVG